jgi:osmoprotectant transport system permease protein
VELLFEAYHYYLEHQGLFWEALRRHLALILSTLAIAVPLGVPVAIWILRQPRAAELVNNGFGTIPSLSLLVLLIPLFGIGSTPAIIALVAYAQLVLVRNIVVGLTGLEPAVIEAARGMGMSSGQLAWRDAASNQAAL